MHLVSDSYPGDRERASQGGWDLGVEESCACFGPGPSSRSLLEQRVLDISMGQAWSTGKKASSGLVWIQISRAVKGQHDLRRQNQLVDH